MGKPVRNANIELARILAMMMIVSIHYWVFAFPVEKHVQFSIPFVLGITVKSVSSVSVNVYVLISAFFLSSSKFKIGRITSVWSQVWFYSVVLFLLVVVFDHSQLTLLKLFSNLTPVLSRQYWFATVFIALLLVAPFINKLLDAITKSQLVYLIAALCAITVVLPTLMVFSSGAYYGHGTDITWFVVLYLIGAYIRRYCDFNRIMEHKQCVNYTTLALCLLPAVVTLAVVLLRYRLTGNAECPSSLLNYNSLFILPGSVAMFIFFATRKPLSDKITKVINKLAVGSFAVYLISDHRELRNYMWSFVVSHTHTASWIMAAEYVVTIVCIYIICFFLDLLYQNFFKKDYFLFLLKKVFGNKIEKLENRINNDE